MENLVDEKLIKVFTIVMGVAAFLTSAQLLITTFFFGSAPWLLSTMQRLFDFDSNLPVYAVMFLGLVIGAVATVAALTKRRRFLVWSLTSLYFYQFFIAVINIIGFSGKGSPAIPALTIGILATMLASYYKTTKES